MALGQGNWRGKGWERLSRPNQRQHRPFKEVQVVPCGRSMDLLRDSDFAPPSPPARSKSMEVENQN